jgi:RND family efflux transporter MFP subunit
MATITSPRKRVRIGRWPLIAGGLLALLVIGALAFNALRGSAPATSGVTPGWETASASAGTIDATVSATGNVEPAAQAELRFAAVDGVVSEILVKPGDVVEVGQPLARIDPTDAELALARAQADLTQARASYEDVAGGATAEEIRQAQAQLDQAKGQYAQAAGQVTRADVNAARARLEQAQARLAQLTAGPKDTDRRDAEARQQQAQATLQSQRDTLSANKTGAELELQRSTTDLTRAQSAYATAKQNWEFVRETGQDPTNPETRTPTGEEIKNKLNETQRQQYYDTFVSAEAGLRAAEVAVQRSQVSYDAARQAEATGVQEAEQQLVIAQAAYDKVVGAADADQLAEARAAVASAQAELGRLTGASREGSLQAAQGAVDAAQANFDKLTGAADPQALARAEADVQRAEAAVKSAERDQARTTLVAPFAGTVARVGLRVGEQAGQNAVVALVDLSGFSIDVPVDELDVAQITPGQSATVALDAMLDRELNGTVTTIEPLATVSERGSNTYLVTVALGGDAQGVLPGMTATVQIVTQRKENVVLVPRRAVQSENGQSFVYVPGTPEQPTQPGEAPAPGVRRPVTLGLSNSQSVEVTSGLTAGEQVLVPDVVQTVNVNVRGG